MNLFPAYGCKCGCMWARYLVDVSWDKACSDCVAMASALIDGGRRHDFMPCQSCGFELYSIERREHSDSTDFVAIGHTWSKHVRCHGMPSKFLVKTVQQLP